MHPETYQAHRVIHSAPTAENINAAALRAARAARTPDLTRKLRYAASVLDGLATELDHKPGDGIGLSYARIWQAVEDAQSAMLTYQNKPVGDLS